MARMRRDQRKRAKKETVVVSNVASASGPSEFEASAVGTPVPEISEMKPVAAPMIAMEDDRASSSDPETPQAVLDKQKTRGKKGKVFADMV